MPTDSTQRRRFLAATAALAGTLAVPRLRAFEAPPLAPAAAALNQGPREQVPALLQPFALNRVKLLPGEFASAAEINRAYLRSLDVDRLAHGFRTQAGRPAPGQPYGGWEKPDCELRGHFAGGHYLSAAALAYASAGDEELKRRGDALVAALAACQQGDGYLSAFPPSFFDRLAAGQKVWAPFYTLHKILAGLLDMYVHAGNTQALELAQGLGNWTVHWLNGWSDAALAPMLKTEYGGMNESLYELYAITGNERYLAAAHRFDQAALFDPLAARRDELQGLHSNTQVPKILGAARRYELTGETRYREIAEFFWQTVTQNRAYATGGSSNDEFWNTGPGDLRGQLGLYSAECCVAYNLLKLTRHVYAWNADPRAFDYYERTLYNARLGTQDAQGLKLYYYPLAAGSAKFYNSPEHSFWCCTGSGAEEFARFNDSIYFHDGRALYVNLFIPSELAWPERGLTLRQDTRFPREPRTALALRLAAPARLAIHLRIPAWIADGGSVRVNGQPLEAFGSPGSYLAIEREWRDGDRIELALPMRLSSVALPGDDKLRAMLYGPLVLAARLGGEGLTRARQYGEYNAGPDPAPKPQPAPRIAAPSAGSAKDAWIGVDSAAELRFTAATEGRATPAIPLNQIQGERYAVYWDTSALADPS